MDPIKTEPEVNPSTVQSRDDAVKEETFSSPKEGSSDMIQVKEEAKLEITKEEDEVVTQSIAFTHNRGVPSYYCNIAEDEDQYADKMYRCNVCGKCFPDFKTLTDHARIHTGDKPLNCDVCGKAFSKTANLKRHARLHTGDNGFSCNICGNVFTSSQHLKTHERTHTVHLKIKDFLKGRHFADIQDMNNTSSAVKIQIGAGDGGSSLKVTVVELG